MLSGRFRRLPQLLLTGLALVAAIPARADIQAYEFQLVETDVKRGDAVITVRLLNKATGKSVADAVIFARRLDMAPDGMPTMTAELEPLLTDEPGVYRFKANFTMQGSWQLSLAAKVQGERGTLQARLGLKAN